MFVERFYNPEKLLRARLAKNPVHPFVVVEPDVYVAVHTPKRYVVAGVVCGLALLATVLLCTIGYWNGVPLQYLVVPLLVMLFFLPQVFVVRGERTLLVDFNQLEYEVCASVCV